MSRENEPTTRFRVDISDMQRGIKEANRLIRLANSEFKAASAGMQDWGNNADALSAKTAQLGRTMEIQEAVLTAMQQEYEKVAAEQGENSAAATNLLIRINNQKAAVSSTRAELQRYETQLHNIQNASEEMADGTDEAESATDSLKSTISDQESRLKQLKKSYSDMVLEQGESSDEAQQLATEIRQLSGSLENNREDLRNAESAANDLAEEFEDASVSTNELDGELNGLNPEGAAGGFTALKGAMANLISEGIMAATQALKDFVSDSATAYNSFQAQTGTASENMGKFQEQIKDLYQNNYGESLNDVADSMAEIKQQTGEVDPSKLHDLTENAIALRDTFDFDIKESIRSANMLMQQFGIDGDEAFGMIIKGTQEGLNKNDDFLDVLNEYAPYYQAQGYTMEEFYNSLKNGVDEGTFSVDKLGDAMKEFGVRSKDTSTTTSDGFKILGYSAGDSTEEISKTKDEIEKLKKNLEYAEMEQGNFNDKTSELTRLKNADKIEEYSKKLKEAKKNLKSMTSESGKSAKTVGELQEQFAAGGEEARDATKEILGKLYNMDDEVQQNAAGVALFGTMWEDLGKDGVKALMDTNGELGDTKQTLEDVKKVKYDDVESQWKQLGRTMQLELLAPIAEKLLPDVKEFVNYCINNIDKIIPVVEKVGTALLVAFAVQKISNFVSAISGLWTVMAANPVGALITAVGLLAGAFVAWGIAEGEAKKKARELTEKQQELIDKSNELKESYDTMDETREGSFDSIESEYGYLQTLADELKGLVDSNGKVTDSNKERADFITNQLSEALGIEKDKVIELIKKNGKLEESIDSLILKKKAEATLSAMEDGYTQAKKEQSKALQNYLEITEEVKEAESELGKSNEKLQEAEENLAKVGNDRSAGSRAFVDARNEAKANADAAQKNLSELKKALDDSEETWVGWNSTIQNYEGLSSAVISGDCEKIETALDNATSNFVTAETGTKRSLESQVKEMKTQYQNMKKAVNDGSGVVTQEMLNDAKTMVDKSVAELNKFGDQSKITGQKGAEGVALGFKVAAGPLSVEAAKAYNQSIKNELSKNKFGGIGIMYGMDLSGGMKSTKKEVVKTSRDISNTTKVELGSADTSLPGKNNILRYDTSMKKEKDTILKTVKGISNTSKVELGSADTSIPGKNGIVRYATAMGGEKNVVLSTTKGISNTSKVGLGSADTSVPGENGIGRYITAMGGQKGNVLKASKGISNISKAGLGSADMNPTGVTKGAQYCTGITSKAGAVNTAGINLANSGKSGAESVNTTSSGEFFGQGFVNGIGNKLASVAAAAIRMAEEALNNLKSRIKQGSPSKETFKSGEFFWMGFANGIKNGISNVKAVSTSLAQTSINGVNETLEIHSPSKKMIDAGRQVPAGLAKGIAENAKTVLTKVSKLAKSMITTMMKANGNYSDVASTITSAFEKNVSNYIEATMYDMEKTTASKISSYNKAINKQLDKEIAAKKKATSRANKDLKSGITKENKKNTEKSIKANNDRLKKELDALKKSASKKKEAYAERANDAMQAYSDAMNESVDAMKTELIDKLTGLADAAQQKYDSIISARDTMYNKLMDNDALYKTIGGNVILTTFDDDIEKINQYGGNLSKLKGKVSESLMNEIADMGMEDALGFTNALLSMSDAELKAYNTSYNKKMEAANKVSKNFYQDQINKVKKEFNDEVVKAMNGVATELTKSGNNAVLSFMKGMESSADSARKQIKKLADSIVKAMNDALKIHSPSKVFRQIGLYSGEGYEIGLSESLKKAKNTVKNVIPFTANQLGATGAGEVSSQTKVYNFYQTNNSPKALSRTEIYRQTQRQIALLKGV